MEHHALMTFRSSAGVEAGQWFNTLNIWPWENGSRQGHLVYSMPDNKLSKYFLMMATSEKHLWPVLSKQFLLTNYCHSKCVFAYKYIHEARNSLSFLFSVFVFPLSFSFLFPFFLSPHCFPRHGFIHQWFNSVVTGVAKIFFQFRFFPKSVFLMSLLSVQTYQGLFSSVQFSRSVVSNSATPWTATLLASLFITISESLLKLTSIESVMPSNHLILCCPLLFPPSIFPSIRGFSCESALHIRWPNIGASASASVLPVNIQGWFPLGWTGLISLLSKGLSRVFSNIKSTNSSALIFLYGPTLMSIHTWLLEKM